VKAQSVTTNYEQQQVWTILSCLLAMLTFQALGETSPKIFEAHAGRICSLLTDPAALAGKPNAFSGLSAAGRLASAPVVPVRLTPVAVWHLASWHWQFTASYAKSAVGTFIPDYSPVRHAGIGFTPGDPVAGGQLRLLALLRRFSQLPPPAAPRMI
jgi:hypothetical protein